jgi:hypothetical protein
MRNRRITAVGLVLVLSLASMSFKCGGGTGPTGQPEPLRNAASAADAIAGSIKELRTAKNDLAGQNKISKDENVKLTTLLLRLNTADKALVSRLKSMNAMPDAAGKQQLLTLFNELTAAVDDANTNGVLGLQNEEARNKLTVTINAIRASLAIIAAVASNNG